MVPLFVCATDALLVVSAWDTVMTPWLSSFAVRLRAPPEPASERICAPGALTSVPAVTASVAEVAALLVSSIAPLFVKPFATVSVELNEALPSTRSVEPAAVVSAPFCVADEITTSVPLFANACATLPAVRVSVPSFAIAPAPFTVQLDQFTTAWAPSVTGPANVSVRDEAVTVCTPEAEPFTRKPASETFWSTVTV